MKKFLFLLVTLISSIVNSQQNTMTVSGIIIDSESNIPLEYATVSISNSKNTEILYGVITDSEGKFNLEVSKGVYNIKIEYISFKHKLIKNINVSNSLDFGTIELSIDENVLDEVELIGEKTEIKLN